MLQTTNPATVPADAGVPAIARAKRYPAALYLSVGLMAGALIALQLAIMRIFAVGSWAHFGSLVVSLAMRSGLRNRTRRGHQRRTRRRKTCPISMSSAGASHRLQPPFPTSPSRWRRCIFMTSSAQSSWLVRRENNRSRRRARQRPENSAARRTCCRSLFG